MAGFDLSSVLKDVSDLNTEEQLVKIELDKLDPDPENFYSLDGLDELAGNIETVGLQQPLRVRPGEGGHFIVVSGHRRRAACMLIRDGGSKQFADGVPCIVEYGEASAALRKLRLIYANSSTRQLTSAEQSRQAEEVTRLLYELKEQGVDFPGRMRDHVAEACQLSKTKIARLHAIRSRCHEYILDAFDQGKISESTAYEFSKLSRFLQHRIYVNHLHLCYKVEALTADDVAELAALYQKLINIRCPEAETLCVFAESHFDVAQRLSHLECTKRPCQRGRCCRYCQDLTSCESACIRLDRLRRETIAAEEHRAAERKADAERQAAERELSRQRHDEECAEIWARIRTAAETTGRDLERVFDELCECDADVQEALHFCSGEAKDTNHLAMDLMDDCLLDLADGLNCSVDYLLGRAPEPRLIVGRKKPEPAAIEPEWQTGRPTRAGRYLVRVKHKTISTMEQRMHFDPDLGELNCWRLFGAPLGAGAEILGWWPLPEEVTEE